MLSPKRAISLRGPSTARGWAVFAWAGVVALALGCSLEIPAASPSSSTSSTDTDTGGGTTEVVDTGGDEDVPVAPSCQCGAPFCRTEGLCKASQPVCEQHEDGTCAWNCDYPTGFVNQEGDDDCDGEDNDCDGVTDDIAPRESDSTTCAVGVCAGAASRCVDGAWRCEESSVPDYQAEETLCDGKDNDCDGETDEALLGTAVDCGFVGVCAQVTDIGCVNGQWACGAKKATAPGYEVKETRCDGLDNDCDGQADNGLVAGPTACSAVGVCGAGTPKATCGAGGWACDYSGIGEYEKAETACDGKDNDCDGLTDEGVPPQTVASCDAASVAKAALGVCTQGVSVSCLDGQLLCDFTSIPTYEAVETLCDGLDNDCDGQTDENLTTAPAGTCSTLGVCSLGSTATCESGVWRCAYGAIPGYEAVEASCDGKDNDCDGQTDEGVVLPPSACPSNGVGICASQPVAATCVAGKAACDFSKVVGYEATEVSCDNLDNDCDGSTDEQIGGAASNLANATCKRLGVCAAAGKVIASCAAGVWSCSYAQLGGVYEEGAETMCDGKDNDCDGFIDENIQAAGLEECSKGVCNTSGSATCVAGKFQCNYGGIVGYENPEASCDGKDNNCDGQTDEGACPNLSHCTDDTQCKSGVCRETPDESERCCVATDDLCPSAGCSAAKNVGETACREANLGDGMSWYTARCTNAGWSTNAVNDRCTTGACADGVCRECVPGTLVCDGTSGVLPCSEAGEYGDPIGCPVNPSGITCNTFASCVCNTDQVLSAAPDPTGLDMRNIAIAATGAASHYAVWTSSQVAGGSHAVVARPLSGYGCVDAGNPHTVNVSQDGSEPAVVFFGGNSAVVAWREKTATDDGNIRVKAVSISNGLGQTSAQFANAGRPNEQGEPAMVKAGNGTLVVAFKTVGLTGGNGFDIGVQTLLYNGSNNLTVPSTSQADKMANLPATGQQTQPALAALDDNRVLVAWTDDTADNPVSLGIYARIYDPGTQIGGGAFVGNPFGLAATLVGDQSQVALSPRAGGFVAAWTSSHAGDDNVYVRTFTNSGSPKTGEVLVSRAPNGTALANGQRNPDVISLPGGEIVVVYEDEGNDIGSNGSGSVWFAQFDKDLNPVNARLVNREQTLNRQLRPALAPAVDAQGTPFVMVGFETENALGPGLNGSYIRPMVLAPAQ